MIELTHIDFFFFICLRLLFNINVFVFLLSDKNLFIGFQAEKKKGGLGNHPMVEADKLFWSAFQDGHGT